MPKPIFIANWKMNLNLQEQEVLLTGIKKQTFPDCVEVVVCPSYTNIPVTAQAIKSTPIMMGAQDLSWVDKGSMTGEVSAEMLIDFRVQYVVIGHSERRHKMGETDEQINEKVKACVKNNLIPVICVGETSEQKEAGQTDMIIHNQVTSALQGLTLSAENKIIIAYEPVWVIGTGHVVDPSIAEHETKVIITAVHDVLHHYGLADHVTDILTVLYGGSVNSENVSDFITDEIRGVLVGGASLEAEEFGKIIKSLSGQK